MRDAERKQEPQRAGGGEQAQDRPRAPAVARAAPGHRQHQRERGEHHQGRARNIELVRLLVPRQRLQRAVGHPQRDEAKRQVDPEDHGPVHVVGQHAAQHRAGDARHHEHDRGVALVARPLPRRDHVADDGVGERQDAAAADALQRARRDQRRHVGRERAGDRADQEDDDGEKHHAPPAVDVGQLAEQRRHRGVGEQIRGHHPGQVLDVAERAPDGRQRRRHDGLLERREEHGEQDADHDGADRGMVERGCGRVGIAVRAFGCGIIHDHRTMPDCARNSTGAGAGQVSRPAARLPSPKGRGCPSEARAGVGVEKPFEQRSEYTWVNLTPI